MNEKELEELEVLVTVDDPEYGPEEDIFDHRHGLSAVKSDSGLQEEETREHGHK
jgi:hypothetical protein